MSDNTRNERIGLNDQSTADGTTDFRSPTDDTADPNATRVIGQSDPLQTTVDPTNAITMQYGQHQIPGYEILGELGKGGMGVVYKARQTRLNRIVALKMILAEEFAGSEERRRFQAEAETVAKLQHPNIVQIYEVGEYHNRPYFSLEYVSGGNLHQYFASTPQPITEVVDLIETIGRAVHEAHAQGIVHRDLKPANVLMTGDGIPKVTDFGLAKHADNVDVDTRTGMIIGTPRYMAPEQATGQVRNVGPLADVYALGVILYEALTGRPPFAGETTLDTLEQVRSQEPVPPRKLRPKLPRDLETICLKCLSKRPVDRYSSAAALADDVRRFRNKEPIRARPVPSWERVWKFARRRPTVASLIVVSILAAASMAVGGWFYARFANQRLSIAERELRDLRELDALRTDVSGLVRAGQEAFAAGDLPKARLELEKAIARANDRSELADLNERATKVLADVRIAISRQESNAASHNKLSNFYRLRDDVFFYNSQITGLDAVSNTLKTRAIATEALKLWNITDRSSQKVGPESTGLTSEETTALSTSCYELMLALADATAQPTSANETPQAQASVALKWIERAIELRGRPTRAALLRQARLQEVAGSTGEAQISRQNASDSALDPLTSSDFFLDATRLMSESRGPAANLAPAIEEFESALRVDPHHFWAQYFIALCNLRGRHPELARASLTACASQRPDFIWTYILRAFVLSELQEFTGADADFDFALNKLKPSDDARYILLVNRGVMRLRQHRLDDAASELRAAIELKPKEFQAHVNLAQVCDEQGNLDAAETEYATALKSQPELAALHRSRSRLRIKRDNIPAALEDLDDAIRLEVIDRFAKVEDLAQKGRLLEHQGKVQAALKAYQQALDLNPRYAPALLLRGELLARLGRHREAVQSFDDYLRVGKEMPNVFIVRGLSRAMVADYAGAINDYSRAIELHSDSNTYALRGWAYIIGNAPKIALSDFHKAVELDNKNSDAVCGRALSLAMMGQLKLAVKDAEDAVKLGPPSPRLLFNAARTYACVCQQIQLETAARVPGVGNLRADYEARAVQLLGRALDILPAADRQSFWKSYVAKDSHLRVIRNSDGFVQLAKPYTEPAKPAAAVQPETRPTSDASNSLDQVTTEPSRRS